MKTLWFLASLCFIVVASIAFWTINVAQRETRRANAYRAQIDQVCATYMLLQEKFRDTESKKSTSLYCSDGSGPKKVLVSGGEIFSSDSFGFEYYMIGEDGKREVADLNEVMYLPWTPWGKHNNELLKENNRPAK